MRSPEFTFAGNQEVAPPAAAELPPRIDDEEAESFIAEHFDLKELTSELAIKLPERTVKSFIRLALELRDELPDYDSIVSDESSGRLPALFFRRLIKRIKGDGGALDTSFIAYNNNSRRQVAEKLAEFLKEKKPKWKKTLLVTEYISSGIGISSLIDKMIQQGMDFDLATLSILKNPDEYADKPELLQRLRFGSVGNAGLDFWAKGGDWAGVYKNTRSYDQYPVKMTTDYNPYYSVKSIRDARKSMNHLADKIAERLLIDDNRQK